MAATKHCLGECLLLYLDRGVVGLSIWSDGSEQHGCRMPRSLVVIDRLALELSYTVGTVLDLDSKLRSQAHFDLRS